MKDAPILKDSLISLKLSDSDIETAVHTWGTVEDNPLVHNAMVEAVIDGRDKSTEEEEKDKAEAHKFELADEMVVGNRTIDIPVD